MSPMHPVPINSTKGATEQIGPELISQTGSDEKSRAISHQDINILFSLVTLLPIALGIDDRRWASICRFLAQVTLAGRLGRRRRRQIEGGLRIAFPADNRLLGTVCRDLEACQLELRLQILREKLRHDWKPEISIQGISHLEAALRAGRGAILWISRFAFADTIAKYALHRAGYPLVHLSRSMHGFSTTRFGRRWLNPMQQRVENRYLAKRVLLHDHSPVAAMRRLKEVLHANGVVSITVYSRGAYVVDAPFMRGRWRIATGAPALAWKTGAQLLPVFVVRDPQVERFNILIDEPLPVNQADSKDEAQKRAVTSYLARLEPYVTANPGQWLGWPSIRAADVK